MSQLCAQLSDPGIHMPIGSQRNSNLNAYCLDLNEEEASKFHTDPIYQNAMFYNFRSCSTCLIERPPKASHCSLCDHCVVGWDHHCTALNNCIGRRNFRAFVSFLAFTILLALSIAPLSLFLLVIGRKGYCVVGHKELSGFLMGTSILLATFFVFLKRWLTWNKKALVLLFGIVSYVAIGLMSYKSLAGILSLGLFVGSLGYMFIIKSMIIDYYELVSRRMT